MYGTHVQVWKWLKLDRAIIHWVPYGTYTWKHTTTSYLEAYKGEESEGEGKDSRDGKDSMKEEEETSSSATW